MAELPAVRPGLGRRERAAVADLQLARNSKAKVDQAAQVATVVDLEGPAVTDSAATTLVAQAVQAVESKLFENACKSR